MSIHPSLRSLGGKGGTYRSVLKRFERLQQLLTQGQWSDTRSIFGLPKTKQERIKVRKAVTAEAAKPEEAAAAGEAAPSSATPTTGKPSPAKASPAGKSSQAA
jgi:small basic protein (TIGR04137 family)